MNRRAWHVVVFGIALGVSGTAHADWQSILMMLKNLMSEASAWAGSAMQTALSGKQRSEAAINSQQMLADSMVALSTYQRTMRAALDFHPAVGQPSSLKCAVQTERKFAVESAAQANRDAATLMQTFSSGRVESKAQGQDDAWEIHRLLYCTAAEARQSLCVLKPNGMQGWDVDYGAVFAQRTLAPEGELAGYAYAAMLADARPSGVIDCPSVACDAASVAHLERAAIASMSAAAIVGQTTSRRVPVLTGR